MNKQTIQAILDADYAMPENENLDELTTRLEGLLGSTDGFLRENALEILWQWSQEGLYRDEQLIAIGDRMAANLLIGTGESETDTVFLRAFSSLVLAGVLVADQRAELGRLEDRTGFLDAGHVKKWFRATLTCFSAEQDRRAFVETKGWSDALAHEADVLSDFARSRHLGGEDLQDLLTAVADKIIEPCDTIFHHNEDHRIVQMVLDILRRNLVSLDDLGEWLGTLSHTKDGGHWADVYGLHNHDGEANIARMNTRSFLRSLYFQLLIGSQTFRAQILPEHFARSIDVRQQLVDAVLDALKAMDKHFYKRSDEARGLQAQQQSE